MDGKHLSDGGACWEFYKEIRSLQNQLAAEEAARSATRSMLELWMKAWLQTNMDGNDMKYLMMSQHFPMIHPDMAAETIREQKEATR